VLIQKRRIIGDLIFFRPGFSRSLLLQEKVKTRVANLVSEQKMLNIGFRQPGDSCLRIKESRSKEQFNIRIEEKKKWNMERRA